MELMASLAAFLSDILLFGTLPSIVNYQMCIEKARNDLSEIEKIMTPWSTHLGFLAFEIQ